MKRQTLIFWIGTVSLLGMITAAAVFAANVTFTSPTTVSLTSPAVNFTVASGSVADAFVINATSVVVTMSSSTGGSFTLTSPSSDLTISTSSVGGTASTSCTNGVASTTITQSTGSTNYTITPTGSPCGGGGGGGGPVGGGGGGVQTAEIAIANSVDNTNPAPGSTIHYTVTVSALGPSVSFGVVAQDLLPTGLTLVNASASEGTYLSSGSWSLGTLLDQTSATLNLTATVNASTSGETITNTATVGESTSLLDPITANNTASVSITVSGGNSASSTNPIGNATSSESSTSSTTISLQATITSLEAQLQLLLTQAAQRGISVNAGGSGAGGTSGFSFTFTRNLQLWSTGTDVNALQRFLIMENTGPAARALQAHGTTEVFGALTFKALKEYQASVGLPSTGFFGPLTRAKANAL